MNTASKLAVSILIAALTAGLAFAAPRLVAPSKFMKQDRYRSAVAKVVEITEEGRFRIEVVEPLYGETPDGLVLRIVGGLGDHVEVGGVYVIGHTDKPSRRSPRWDTDPSGPRVLSVPAVGPAVFENSSAMRTLVRDHPADSPLTDIKRLAATIEQLASSDISSRRFVLAELAIDAELRALVGDSELEVLRGTLASGELEPMAHDYLLRAARPMIENWGGAWLAADCRKVAEDNGPDLDLNSLVPSLLVTALDTLGETGVAADAPLARRYIESNNPGVGKAAFAAMLALDRESAIALAPSLVADESLHLDVRRFVHQESAVAPSADTAAGSAADPAD